jgi:hypothetical protein
MFQFHMLITCANKVFIDLIDRSRSIAGCWTEHAIAAAQGLVCISSLEEETCFSFTICDQAPQGPAASFFATDRWGQLNGASSKFAPCRLGRIRSAQHK